MNSGERRTKVRDGIMSMNKKVKRESSRIKQRRVGGRGEGMSD